MTGGLALKPRAQSDLDENWDYTAHKWGLDQDWGPSPIRRRTQCRNQRHGE